ncbi:MAG: phenylalanine--tRNA ligase subunit alpha [Chloroflexi bacterium]|nr:phenylalanine--tRNA ligase subunit alpha [Chloroflexota bacterium]
MSHLEELDRLKEAALAGLESLSSVEALEEWRVAFFGKKGEMTTALKRIGSLPPDDRPAYGQASNEVKLALQAAYEAKLAAVQAAELESRLRARAVDVTLPGRPPALGRLHPSTQTLRSIYRIFAQMGFRVYLGRDVELDLYNFELLNMPPHHPARDMWDTFYTTREGVLLRTHTSPGQIHAMREYAPEPLRVILPGKCYRYEQVTARSESMFHQVEGLAVGPNITMADLKGTMINFARQMFGPQRQVRFRCSHFPFTEPSVAVDMDCILCGGKGCRLCKGSGWLEISGAGMVHPTVLKNGGYDPAVVSGFAFGMGPERIAMLRHGIEDIRYFFGNDLRFLRQF